MRRRGNFRETMKRTGMLLALFSLISGLTACSRKNDVFGSKEKEIPSLVMEETVECMPYEEQWETAFLEEETENPAGIIKKVRPADIQQEYKGRFFCFDEENQGYLLDKDSKLIAKLPKGTELCKFPNDKFFIGNYFLLNNNTIWNIEGKQVFSLQDSGYQEIFYADTLDVDYLVLAKHVNTFELTGTVYCAWNVADGTSFQYEDGECPGQEYWYYFGNGNFIYAAPNLGFGNEHTVYHIQNNERISATMLLENGEVTSTMPDIYFWKKLNYDDEALYGVYCDDNYINYRMVYRFDTGQAQLYPLQAAVDYPEIWFSGDVYAKNAAAMGGGIRYKEEHPMLLQYQTGVLTPMDDYQSYSVYSEQNGAYLCIVENAGGGRFFTVVEADGTRRFEPISIEEGFDYFNETYITIRENNKLFAYNWNGELLDTIDCDYFDCAYGKNTIVYTIYAEKEGAQEKAYLLDMRTGTTKELPSLMVNGERRIFEADMEENNFRDTYFISNGAVLSEDGEFTVLSVPESS